MRGIFQNITLYSSSRSPCSCSAWMLGNIAIIPTSRISSYRFLIFSLPSPSHYNFPSVLAAAATCSREWSCAVGCGLLRAWGPFGWLINPEVKFSLGGHSPMVIEQNIERAAFISQRPSVLYWHSLFLMGTRSKASFLLPAETRHGADYAMDMVSAVPPACGALSCVLHSPGRSHSFPISPTGSENSLNWKKPTTSVQIPSRHAGCMPLKSEGARPAPCLLAYLHRGQQSGMLACSLWPWPCGAGMIK